MKDWNHRSPDLLKKLRESTDIYEKGLAWEALEKLQHNQDPIEPHYYYLAIAEAFGGVPSNAALIAWVNSV